MPKPKTTKTPAKPGPNNVLQIAPGEDESDAQATARAIMAPDFRHAMPNAQLLNAHFNGSEDWVTMPMRCKTEVTRQPRVIWNLPAAC